MIIALLGVLGLLKPVEGFADGDRDSSRGPVMFPAKPPAMKGAPPNTYNPAEFAKGAAAGGGQTDYKFLGGEMTSANSLPSAPAAIMANLKQVCAQLPELELYKKNLPTPPPAAKQLDKQSPALNQGKITQLNKSMSLQSKLTQDKNA